MRCIRCLRVGGSPLSRSRALSNTRSSEPSGTYASGIPAVADAMNRQTAVCPSVRNKARLWLLQSQTLRANRAGTPPLSTADRSGARNALTAQGGGSGHVAPPTSFRQCGDRATGNCRRFLAVGGEQRAATDNRRATAPIERSRRGRGVSLATEQRAMTRTGLPAFNEQLRRQDCNAAALNVPSDLARRHPRLGVCRRAFRRAACARVHGSLAVRRRAAKCSPTRAATRHPAGIRAVSARQSAMQARVVHRAGRPATAEQLPHRSEEGLVSWRFFCGWTGFGQCHDARLTTRLACELPCREWRREIVKLPEYRGAIAVGSQPLCATPRKGGREDSRYPLSCGVAVARCE
jgi:hypothetical protein